MVSLCVGEQNVPLTLAAQVWIMKVIVWHGYYK